MRDSTSLQRRRRNVIRQSDSELTIANGSRSDAFEQTSSKLTSFSSADLETEFDFDAFEAATLSVTREQFFRDCHGRSGCNIVMDVAGKSYTWTFAADQPSLIVGSGADCDLRIEDPQLPNRMCYLQWIDGNLYGFDIQSINPSQPDRLPASIRIDQQPVQIGLCRFVMLDQPKDVIHGIHSTSPIDKSAVLESDFPRLRLTFAAVEQEDNHWPIDRPLTLIGRSSRCKLRLVHQDMPDILASVIRTPAACWLVDLAGVGRTGTIINNRPVKVTQVDLGDVIQLGPFQATVTSSPYSDTASNSQAFLDANRASAPQTQPIPAIAMDDRSVDRSMMALDGESKASDSVTNGGHHSDFALSVSTQIQTEGSVASGHWIDRQLKLVELLDQRLSELQSFIDCDVLSKDPLFKGVLEGYISFANETHQEMRQMLSASGRDSSD